MSEKKLRGKAGKKRARRLQEIETRRQEVAHALDVLRLGMHREFTFLPKGEKWLLPSVAFGLGLALAGRSSSPAPAYRAPVEEPEESEREANGGSGDRPGGSESAKEAQGAEDSSGAEDSTDSDDGKGRAGGD